MSNIVVPSLGESVVEARVARWLKQEGDRVEVGEPVVELETEKVDLEVPAEKGGVVRSIARKEGEDVKIGDLLGVIDESAAAPTATPPADAPASDQQASPAARGMRQDLEQAMGGTPSPAAAVAAASATPNATGAPGRGRMNGPGERPETRTRMSMRRATIARRLVEAQRTAAMLTTFNEIDMTALMALRERCKEPFRKQYGISLGISSFFVKAAVVALRAFPQLNAEIEGDEIVLKHYYDIGLAVGAEGGLVVPVLRDADLTSFAGVEQAIRDFAQRAKDGTLTLEDLVGGTFTITNGGVFGSMLSTPILNPPQVGILGLHKIEDRVVPLGGHAVIRPMMYVALSYDHRLVDGREAVQFLVKVKEFIEDPGLLLIES
jgi:2-oxoglutarate dehydrogenase E2 component (dihydrolipoamide succinyltransferase)